MKKLFLGLYILAVLSWATNSFAVMIDDFNEADFSTKISCGGGGQNDAIPESDGAIYSSMILFMADSVFLCSKEDSATFSISEGVFSYHFTETMQGFLKITWAACLTQTSMCDYKSLDGVDLTESDTHDSFRLRVLSNTAPGVIFLTVYTDEGYFSTAMVIIGDITTSTDIYIPFDSFDFVNGPSGQANFSYVGAIEMYFGKDGARNLVIDEIVTAALPPEEQIEEIQDTFENALMLGDLSGAGPTETAAAGKLSAFDNMLIEAEYLIDTGSIEEACNQLYSIYKKTDGIVLVPDFVTGDAAADLAAQILKLMESLGCEYF